MHVAAATIGIDSPTGAALVSLSAIVGPAVVAEGETPAAAVQIVMLVFTAAALASGALLYCIGVFRRERTAGSSPISSSADFSQLPGWLLAVGSIRMATGIAPALEPAGLAWTWISTIKLATCLLLVPKKRTTRVHRCYSIERKAPPARADALSRRLAQSRPFPPPSGEYRFDVLMTPSAQKTSPPECQGGSVPHVDDLDGKCRRSLTPVKESLSSHTIIGAKGDRVFFGKFDARWWPSWRSQCLTTIVTPIRRRRICR